MLTAQEAVKKAVEYYREISNLHYQPTVEEVDKSEDGDWLITLGIERADKINAVSALYGNTKVVYKIFSIDVESGDVLSMKIRD